MKVLWLTRTLQVKPDEGELLLVLTKEEVEQLEAGELVWEAGIEIKRKPSATICSGG